MPSQRETGTCVCVQYSLSPADPVHNERAVVSQVDYRRWETDSALSTLPAGLS